MVPKEVIVGELLEALLERATTELEEVAEPDGEPLDKLLLVSIGEAPVGLLPTNVPLVTDEGLGDTGTTVDSVLDAETAGGAVE